MLEPAIVVFHRATAQWAASGRNIIVDGALPYGNRTLRNACLAAANSGRSDLIPCLKDLAEKDPHPMVREHAAWAVSQLAIK